MFDRKALATLNLNFHLYNARTQGAPWNPRLISLMLRDDCKKDLEVELLLFFFLPFPPNFSLSNL